MKEQVIAHCCHNDIFNFNPRILETAHPCKLPEPLPISLEVLDVAVFVIIIMVGGILRAAIF
jgi:hypothetical protein